MTTEEQIADRIWAAINAARLEELAEVNRLASVVVHQFDESLRLTEPGLHARFQWHARHRLVRLIARRATASDPSAP